MFAQLAWLDVSGLDDAPPDWAGTLNCDEYEEPSSYPLSEDEPDDEPEDDEPE
jgi:hypothetical protein